MHKKLDLSDVTFNIPIRFDAPARKDNIELVLRYLVHHLDTHIIVCEEAAQQVFAYLRDFGCRYVYRQSSSPYLHRTRCLNMMTEMAETPIICNCDADVLLPPAQYVAAVDQIRKNRLDACFPYDGEFYNVPAKLHGRIRESCSLAAISSSDCKLLNRSSLGGALFWNRESFVAGGMENETFVGWGYEDNELLERFAKLGYRIGRIGGSLFHLDHPRPSISSFNSLRKIMGYLKNPVLRNNKREYRRVKSMSKEELSAYVASWKKEAKR